MRLRHCKILLSLGLAFKCGTCSSKQIYRRVMETKIREEREVRFMFVRPNCPQGKFSLPFASLLMSKRGCGRLGKLCCALHRRFLLAQMTVHLHCGLGFSVRREIFRKHCPYSSSKFHLHPSPLFDRNLAWGTEYSCVPILDVSFASAYDFDAQLVI